MCTKSNFSFQKLAKVQSSFGPLQLKKYILGMIGNQISVYMSLDRLQWESDKSKIESTCGQKSKFVPLCRGYRTFFVRKIDGH